MGLLDKIKNMFNKVDETVNTPPPSQPTDQAPVDPTASATPASQEPASIGGISNPPADLPESPTPEATPENPNSAPTAPPTDNLPQ